MDGEEAKRIFKNFASFSTPISILTKGTSTWIKDTNITRIDQLKLWWQLKFLSVEKLSLVDLGHFSEEIITSSNQKVLGVDTVSLNREIKKYLENLKLADEHFKVKIVNASQVAGAARLAADFAASVGAEVVKVESQDVQTEKTIVLASDKNSYSARYLANLFDCDINSLQNLDDGQIEIRIGRDFATKYFQ